MPSLYIPTSPEKSKPRSGTTNNYIERQPNGKMRTTSGSWDDEKVFLHDQVLEGEPSTVGSMSTASASTTQFSEWTMLEKVLERMATSEDTTLVIRREDGGKMRVTSRHWEDPKVLLRGEVLEIRNVDGRLHVARKARHHDEWDPPIEPYDPYGPDNGIIES
jgi:hypothetical protein